jgi:hypothetical protein
MSLCLDLIGGLRGNLGGFAAKPPAHPGVDGFPLLLIHVVRAGVVGGGQVVAGAIEFVKTHAFCESFSGACNGKVTRTVAAS